MSKEAALATLRLAEEVHAGKRPLPPEILDLKARIAKACRNAYLFMYTFNVVDEGMVQKAVGLKLELDILYIDWAESET
jgi:hypothetical protein